MPSRVIKKLLFLSSAGLSWLLLARPAFAQPAVSRYLPKIGNLDPATIQDLGGLIAYLFALGIWVVGLAIFIQFLRAGIEWLLAGPSITTVQSAKNKMKNALLGFMLLLAAYLILNVINPDLVNQDVILPAIKPNP